MKAFNYLFLKKDLSTCLDVIELPEMVDKALVLSMEAHRDQFRANYSKKSEPIPYIVHPVGVAKNVVQFWSEADFDDDLEVLIATALLHDVIEDTKFSKEDIDREIGPRCADLVQALSKPDQNDFTNTKERTQKFIEQIQAGGRSAVYLKGCDVLHNLKQPSTMPVYLLRKTLAKANGPYRELINGFGFSERIFKELEDSIRKGMYVLNQRSKISSEDITFESFISTVVNDAKSKPLEEHDVIGYFERLVGVGYCMICEKPEFEKNRFEEPSFTKNKLNHVISELQRKGESIFKLRRINMFGESGADTSTYIDAIISVPFRQYDTGPERNIFIYLNSSNIPLWLSKGAVEAALSVMCSSIDRKSFADRQYLSNLLLNSSLDIDLEEALDAKLNFYEIRGLEKFYKYASYVCDLIKSILVDSLAKRDNIIVVDTIQGRVKTPGSCFRKIGKRGLSGLADMEDMVGIRIVTLDVPSKNGTVDVVASLFTKNCGAFPFELDPLSSVRVDAIDSASGYTATHVRFSISSYGSAIPLVGCEIQIRTAYEDFWSKVSYSLRYKKENNTSKVTDLVLRDLKKEQSKIDGIMEKIS